MEPVREDEVFSGAPAQEETSDQTMIRLLQKQLKMQRLLAAIMGGILLAFVIFGAILVPRLITTVSQVNRTLRVVDSTIETVNDEVLPKVSELDMKNINKAVSTMEKAVSEFDVEGMNEAIDDLRSAVDDLDIEALNEAIDSLNTTIQPLKNFVEMFGGKK